jgi:hypothetical protein
MLRINSKDLYGLFLNLGFSKGKKSEDIKIPQEILKGKELTRATLRGIFDTDVCIFLDKRKLYKKPYSRITLQLASKDLINQLEAHLSKSFKMYINKINRDGYRNYIELYGHNQLEKFLKQVGFSNKRHLSKVQKYASVA